HRRCLASRAGHVERRGRRAATRGRRARGGRRGARRPARDRPGQDRVARDPPGMTYAVWAPLLERVRVQVDGEVHEMRRDTSGWWRADVPERAGARYAYLLDDDEQPLPDPRSRRQPDGV